MCKCLGTNSPRSIQRDTGNEKTNKDVTFLMSYLSTKTSVFQQFFCFVFVFSLVLVLFVCVFVLFCFCFLFFFIAIAVGNIIIRVVCVCWLGSSVLTTLLGYCH